MKVIGKHSKNCYSVKEVERGYWENAWSRALPKTRFGSKNNPFSPSSTTIWLIFDCNCTECSAKLAVPYPEFAIGWPKK